MGQADKVFFRRIVACESNIIVHYERNKLIWSGKFQNEDTEDTEEGEKLPCIKTYFTEPLAWMKDVTHNVQGKLNCPKCATKLGSYSWVMGKMEKCII